MIIPKLHLTNSWLRLETNIPKVVNAMQEVLTRTVVGKSSGVSGIRGDESGH